MTGWYPFSASQAICARNRRVLITVSGGPSGFSSTRWYTRIGTGCGSATMCGRGGSSPAAWDGDADGEEAPAAEPGDAEREADAAGAAGSGPLLRSAATPATARAARAMTTTVTASTGRRRWRLRRGRGAGPRCMRGGNVTSTE